MQWALGKAGEDRVHVVVSEELGWLFVGIYDGFNGGDAPEFLMGNLYRAVHNELQGLFWELEEEEQPLPQESNPVVEGTESKRRKLWELLAEDGLDLSGSDRFAFSVDDALSVNNANAGSAVGGGGLDDEGMSSALALFLEAICKKRKECEHLQKNQVNRKIKVA